MGFNIEKFKSELKPLTKSTFQKCLEKVDANEICGFSLYSDNSAMTISVSLNTHGHLEEMKEDDPEYEAYFRWTPGEWKYEMINAKAFAELNEMLQKAHLDETDIAFLTHRNKVYNCAVEVLEELKQEGIFTKMEDDFVLMFAVSDFSEPELETNFVQRLNSEQLTNEFEVWLESEKDED